MSVIPRGTLSNWSNASLPERFIVISGCSGGGKSTLLEALAVRGFACVPEPGRRIVHLEQQTGGDALPWINPRAFAERAVAMARADLAEAAKTPGVTFFDRGLVDAAVALAHAGGPPYMETLGPVRAYGQTVFLAPPWPEIYATDAARKHGFAEAKAEYHRLVDAFGHLGYATCTLPKDSVDARISLILEKTGFG